MPVVAQQPKVALQKSPAADPKPKHDPLNQDPLARMHLLRQARSELEDIAADKKPADGHTVRLAHKWVATIKAINDLTKAIQVDETKLTEMRTMWTRLDAKLEVIADSYMEGKA